MTDKSKQQTKRDRAIFALDAAIRLVNIGKEASSMTPAPAVFAVVAALLTTIKGKMVNEQGCVDLGTLCADVCDALKRGTNGKRTDELSESVRNAIDRLETSIQGIQQEVDRLDSRNELVKYFTADSGKEKIAGWKSELTWILQVFNTELGLTTHTVVAATHTVATDTHHAVMEMHNAIVGQNRVTGSGVPQRELPPPPPKVFFGRDGFVQRIVSSAEVFASMALIGTGGIGKTSIILTALDDRRIKKRFGDNRTFISCDQLTSSHTHFLQRLSEATGAGIENPEDLSSMRQYLSSRGMIIVLDNAESILGLADTNTQKIHKIVDELSQFSNICLTITSRISNALPTNCEMIVIPTLSMDAGQETFYRIRGRGERSDEVNDILKELEFHPLSITLLATVSKQNRWNTKRLTTEWEKQRTGVLQSRSLGSLAAAIELSLTSPMFQELGPDAREVLGVVAFFPQGVHEDNVGGLFSKVSDRQTLFDTFYNLSLTYRGNGFITMLAPLRDYLHPADPTASPPLLAAKEYYFGRLSVELCPGEPGFEESRWIKSEDVNVEHLIDVFASDDPDSENVWDACYHFMDHLYWHKPRLAILGLKVEALPDTHPAKPRCLLFLSRLFAEVGNWAEQKRILDQSLGLWREKGEDYWVAEALIYLSDVNRTSEHHREGIQQAEEALEIFKKLGETRQQAHCLIILASLFLGEQRFPEAGKAASRAKKLSKDRDEFGLCQIYRVLGALNLSKGKTKKAIRHFEKSLRIASRLGLGTPLSEGHLSLAYLYIKRRKLTDARTHSDHAKSHAGNDMHRLGRAFYVSACVLFEQARYMEVVSEVSRALAIFEKLGATDLAGEARQLLEETQKMIDELNREDAGPA